MLVDPVRVDIGAWSVERGWTRDVAADRGEVFVLSESEGGAGERCARVRTRLRITALW